MNRAEAIQAIEAALDGALLIVRVRDEQIRADLLAAGHSDDMVREIFIGRDEFLAQWREQKFEVAVLSLMGSSMASAPSRIQ